MSNLRSKLIRLAHARPDLRPHLLPLLGVRTAAEDAFEEAIKGKKFKNPETGNQVQFSSLPADEQKKVRESWSKKNEGKGGSKGSAAEKSMKALQSSGLSSSTKKMIEEKMKSNPDSFRDSSKGKAKVKGEGEEATFTPPGYLKSFSDVAKTEEEEKAAEAAMKEWAGSQLGMSGEDLEEWYDLELLSSSEGTFKATIKPSMKKKATSIRTAAKAQVVVYGGKIYEYSEDELRGFLDSNGEILSRYKFADNLPKWMGSSKALKLRGIGQVAEVIRKMIEWPGTVTVNVRQDKPELNKIDWN